TRPCWRASEPALGGGIKQPPALACRWMPVIAAGSLPPQHQAAGRQGVIPIAGAGDNARQRRSSGSARKRKTSARVYVTFLTSAQRTSRAAARSLRSARLEADTCCHCSA